MLFERSGRGHGGVTVNYVFSAKYKGRGDLERGGGGGMKNISL